MNDGGLITNVPLVSSYLVVADGDGWVQKVSDLPEVLESLFLQCQPFTVSFPNGLVHQQPHFLNLGYCQGLCMQKHKRWQRIKQVARFRGLTEIRSINSHTANASAVTDSRSCASSGRVSSSPTGSFFYVHKISTEQHTGTFLNSTCRVQDHRSSTFIFSPMLLLQRFLTLLRLSAVKRPVKGNITLSSRKGSCWPICSAWWQLKSAFIVKPQDSRGVQIQSYSQARFSNLPCSVYPVGPKSRLDYSRRQLDFGNPVQTDDNYNICFEGRNEWKECEWLTWNWFGLSDRIMSVWLTWRWHDDCIRSAHAAAAKLTPPSPRF